MMSRNQVTAAVVLRSTERYASAFHSCCSSSSSSCGMGSAAVARRLFSTTTASSSEGLSRRSRALTLHTHATSGGGCCCSPHLRSARTLFGAWRSAAAAPPDETASNVHVSSVKHASGGVDGQPPSSPAGGAHADPMVEIKQLRQQVVDLKEALEASQETVKQLLVLSSKQTKGDGGASSLAASDGCGAPPLPCGPCGYAASAAAATHARGACYVVRTSEELVDALRGRGSEHASRTILLDGTLFFLDLFTTVEVDQARVSIVGNNATVVGRIAVKGRGAVLSASDVFFLCPHGLNLRPTDAPPPSTSTAALPPSPPSRTAVNALGKQATENAAHLAPVLSATAGAGIHLDRCVVSNGRDGVYLGMGSHCTLNHVRVVNCIRGVYEGVGCRLSVLSDCTLQSNRYHVVMLGPNGVSRKDWLSAPSAAAAAADSKEVTPPKVAAHEATFRATFSSAATAADVLPAGLTNSSVLYLQQTKAQLVLQHNPITDIYEDCWSDGRALELTGSDATSGLSDPLF